MGKNFQFHSAAGEFLQFFHRDLPFQDHPFDAQLFGQFQAGRVMESHLGGGMDIQMREIFPDHPQNAQILYNEGIGVHLIQQSQIFRHFREFRLFDNGVHCHINFAVPFVEMFNDFSHIIRRKIFAPFPGVEFGKTRINGIRPGIVCGHGRQSTSGGGQ